MQRGQGMRLFLINLVSRLKLECQLNSFLLLLLIRIDVCVVSTYFPTYFWSWWIMLLWGIEHQISVTKRSASEGQEFIWTGINWEMHTRKLPSWTVALEEDIHIRRLVPHHQLQEPTSSWVMCEWRQSTVPCVYFCVIISNEPVLECGISVDAFGHAAMYLGHAPVPTRSTFVIGYWSRRRSSRRLGQSCMSCKAFL
jgi:hypothetical protein